MAITLNPRSPFVLRAERSGAWDQARKCGAQRASADVGYDSRSAFVSCSTSPRVPRETKEPRVLVVIGLCEFREASNLLREGEDLLGGLDQPRVLRFCELYRLPVRVADDLPLGIRPVLLMRMNVERKIASSETIIVRSPNG
jgi:hypothetical protein